MMISYMLSWYWVSTYLLALLICKLIYLFFKFKRKASCLADVSQHKSHWFLGHIPLLLPTEKAIRFSFKVLNKFPKCMQVWFGPFVLYFSCFHPDVMKPILATDEPKDEIGYRFLRPWIGDGLLTSAGKKWKRNRQMLTRAFHFDILKHYLVVFNNTAGEIVDKWLERHAALENSTDSISVEVFNDVSLMTLDSILQCIISTKSNCQRVGNKDEYLHSVRVITEVAMMRLFNPLLQIDFFFNLSSLGKKYHKALKASHDYTEKVIKNRKLKLDQESWELEKYISSQNCYRSTDDPTVSQLDFLDILLLSKDSQGVGLSHQEICDEVNTFVFEGHDTVSSGLSWAFYNLSLYPETQELCRKEVQEVLQGGKNVEWDDLSKFSYLTKFIKESLRMHSPVFTITRRLTKPLFYPRGFGSDQFNTDPHCPSSDASRMLPKDINIGLSLLQLHRNPFIWEDPDRFDPERFTPENISKRSPYSFLPFSSGPRNCIGQHFAMNEMKVTLAKALMHFRFSLDATFPKPEMEPYIILRSKNGIHLKLERI